MRRDCVWHRERRQSRWFEHPVSRARLEGTNVEEGRRIMRHSGLNIEAAKDLDDAADKAVKASVIA